MSRYLALNDVDVTGLRVLVRADLNVPMERGAVSDDFRLRAALPTLEDLVRKGAVVTVCSHLGRPEGDESSLSLRPIARLMDQLNDILGQTGALDEPTWRASTDPR